jgi:hypothetical protein
MRNMNAIALSAFVRKTAESASDFAGVIHNLILDVRDSYRPELHYMRGPGPKWRAKHQRWPGVQSVTQAEQLSAVAAVHAPSRCR